MSPEQPPIRPRSNAFHLEESEFFIDEVLTTSTKESPQE